MNEFQALANAIIEQAAKDYRGARKMLKKNPYHPVSLETVAEIEEFFLSAWIKALTTVSGSAVLRLLKEEFDT